jgi:nitroreductase
LEVLQAIKTRRSIRKYKADPVDDQTLETVLEAARWAPSWENTQCWRFIVVRDVATKSKLADTLDETNPAKNAVRNAPLVIAACAELGKAGRKDGQIVTDKGDWFMFDVALAMQNLVLAAHSLGLATVYVGRFDAKEAAKVLAVPEGYCFVALTPLGYPDQIRDPRPRKELPEIVFYEKWGNR